MGPELSVLLEILVTAANEGSLAEVNRGEEGVEGVGVRQSCVRLQIPGRWEVFISELRVGALEDCVTFYESDMKLLFRMNNNGTT